MMEPLYLNALGLVTPLGNGKTANSRRLFDQPQRGLRAQGGWLPDRDIVVGDVIETLSDAEIAPIHDSRNNRLALTALEEIRPELDNAIAIWGRNRIAVVVGTSTSGIGDNESKIIEKVRHGSFPDDFQFAQQETGSLSRFLSDYLGLTGPSMTVSTACSSSAKALASGCRMIRAGLVDAALVGGADSLCRLTTRGFDSLDSLAAQECQPFSLNRDGINIGEGAALFLVTKEKAPISVAGIGETSDAYHLSAPSPQGEGAFEAMRLALEMANVEPDQVGYLNLHGTATAHNDLVESLAVSRLFPAALPCSSTKGMTGHMLGAAGAVEIAFVWLMFSAYNPNHWLPFHFWDGVVDSSLAPLHLTSKKEQRDPDKKIALSNSFAFGGNNISVALSVGGDH